MWNNDGFAAAARPVIEAVFLNLLEKKHLYQSVEIDTSALEDFAAEMTRIELQLQSQIEPGRGGGFSIPLPSKSKEQIREDHLKDVAECLRSWPYCLEGSPRRKTVFSAQEAEKRSKELLISVPTVRTTCRSCDGLWPHNASEQDLSFLIPSLIIDGKLQQLFFLQYQCQNCRAEPISFLVKRNGLKLTLTGRSPMEVVEIPRFIPKGVRKYYGEAVIAYNSGALLPAIFMLRTLIEQHMRAAIAAEKRMTGDELAEAYTQSLAPNFNRVYQSLKPVYTSLSEAIHAAIDDNPQLYEENLSKILNHFEAKEAFERLAAR